MRKSLRIKTKLSRQTLTRQDLEHVTKLANLPLTEEQKKVFLPQLSKVLEYVTRVREVDTKNIAETSQVTGIENVFREDEIRPSLSQEEALQNAPASHNGFIKVKYVFGQI